MFCSRARLINKPCAPLHVSLLVWILSSLFYGFQILLLKDERYLAMRFSCFSLSIICCLTTSPEIQISPATLFFPTVLLFPYFMDKSFLTSFEYKAANMHREILIYGIKTKKVIAKKEKVVVRNWPSKNGTSLKKFRTLYEASGRS